MTVRRTLVLIFGLVLVSIIAKNLVWYLNPSFRLHRAGYDFDYSTLNYIQFFILFLIPSIAAVFLYRADFKIINNFYNRTAGAVKKLFLAGSKNQEAVLVIAVTVFWIFNLMEYAFFRTLIENKNPFDLPFDTFHEGLKLGSLYNFLNNDQGLNQMFIHGYFLDILTPYLAYLIAPENHGVMGYRVLFTLETLLCWLGSIWIIWEIVNFTTEQENKILPKIQFILFSIVFVACNGSFLILEYQVGFMLLQLGLVLHFLRKVTYSDSSPKFILVVSFIIGLSVPLGLLYATKYGMLFSVVFVLAIFLLFFHEQYKLFLLGSSLGATFFGTIACLMLGWEQVLEIGKTFVYLLEFFYARFTMPFISDANEHYLWIPQLVIGILIICGIQIIVNFKQSKNFQSFIRENTHLIILLSLSIMVSKIALDFSDKTHFRTIAPVSLFLLFASTAGWMNRLDELRYLIIQSYTTHKTTCVLVFIFLLFINMHPKEAFRHVKPYWKQISTTDEEILARKGYSYLMAVEEMRPEIKNMECFYTLTSESGWYYFFKKPSCSRYHSLVFAIGKAATDEIIDALRSKHPEVILFSNYRSFRSFDGSRSHPELYKFIYKNYRPYKLVGNHWFWKRSSGGIAGAQVTKLDITSSITNLIYDSFQGVIILEGILNLKSIYNIDSIYITPSDHKTPLTTSIYDNMIRVKSGFLEIPWSIEILMTNVLPETKSFQLWGYSSGNHERIKIGEEFTLDHSKINIGNMYVFK